MPISAKSKSRTLLRLNVFFTNGQAASYVIDLKGGDKLVINEREIAITYAGDGKKQVHISRDARVCGYYESLTFKQEIESKHPALDPEEEDDFNLR